MYMKKIDEKMAVGFLPTAYAVAGLLSGVRGFSVLIPQPVIHNGQQITNCFLCTP